MNLKQSKPRIAILSVHSSPLGKAGAKDTGGMSTYIREVAGQLSRLGYILDIFTRSYGRQSKGVIELDSNVRLIPIKAGGKTDLDKLLIYSYLPDYACFVENFRRHEGVRYDLIFSHYWLSGVLGQTLQYWWRVPHIIMFHTLGAVKNALGIGEDEPELRIKTEGELARACQRLIAATVREEDQLVNFYSAKPEIIKVIPCGVNLDLFRPADKKLAKNKLGFNSEKIILFVGRIEKLKGISNLLKSLPVIKNYFAPRLVIVGGDGRSQTRVNRLKRLSEKLNISDRVTFAGLIDYEEMPCYYRAADICAVPSYSESFGLVALESLACGTPVVSTDVGDIKNIIIPGKTGYVVKDNNPEHFASKINEMLEKCNGVNTETVRASVARFSWKNVTQSLIHTFNEALSEYK